MVVPTQPSDRRNSEPGIDKPSPAADRRKTIAAFGKENASSTPLTKTPGKQHRVQLGAASAYYFKTTPLMMNTSVNESVDVHGMAAESSFLSSTSSSEGETLNQSVLSDTTEYTASQFVFATSAKQRFSIETSTKTTQSHRLPLADTLVPHENAPPVAAPLSKTQQVLQMAETIVNRRLSRQLERDAEQSHRDSITTLSLPNLSLGEYTNDNQQREQSPLDPLEVSASSINNLFDDLLLPNKQSEQSLTSTSTTAGHSRTFSTTAASPASTVSTKGAKIPNATTTSTAQASPRPLPEAIAFDAPSTPSPTNDSIPTSPMTRSSERRQRGSPRPLPDAEAFQSSPNASYLRADTNSPFRIQPNSHKKPTPTKLQQSPRRVPNPEKVDSPARNTRSAAKKRFSLEGNSLQEATTTEEENNNKRAMEDTTITGNNNKRRKSSILSVSGGTSTPVPPRSSLRKATSGKGIKKSVAFGSPEMMEYNVSSPSMSMTPVPSNRTKLLHAMPDSTVEIEADMQELLQRASEPEPDVNANDAGSTPYHDKKHATLEEDETVELENNLDQLLDQSNESPPAMTRRESTTQSQLQQLLEATSDDDNMSVDDTIDFTVDVEHTVELEADMGALLEKVEPTEHLKPSTIMEEEDHTVELEMDMNTLLAAANDKEEEEEANVSQRRLSRRSSMSSRRFSLAPPSRFSLNSSGVAESLTASILEEPADEPTEVFDLQLQEILDLFGVANASTTSAGDVLMIAKQETKQVPLTFASMNAVYAEVCREIESTLEEDIDPTQVIHVSETNQAAFLDLQKAVRTGERPQVRDMLNQLAIATKEREESDWLQWLVAVIDALNAQLGAVAYDIDERLRHLDEISHTVDQMEQTILEMESIAVRRARRKSFDRRAVDLAAIEDEIACLESEIKRSQMSIEKSQSDQRLVIDMDSAMRQNASLQAAASCQGSEAETSERRWVTLKGINKFKPVVINESTLCLHYVGICPQTCISVSFDISRQPITCLALPEPRAFNHSRHGIIRLSKQVLPFVKARVRSICKSASENITESPDAVKFAVHKLAWELGRLEHTTSELLFLQKRYEATFVLERETDCFVEIDFAVPESGTKVSTTFELSSAYPFSPLQVCLDLLDGDTDMENLRKLLIKNAKPGFGYLSRTCDVIASSLR